MAAWILGMVIGAIMVAVIVAVATSSPGARARQERRRRYRLEETDERIGFSEGQTTAGGSGVIGEAPAPERHFVAPAASMAGGTAELPQPRPGKPPIGRIVSTPEGETILTTPPFALREAVFTRRAGRYVAAMYRRLPPWVVVCPKVRLDSLLIPTRPDGRLAEDWRMWRQRVRMRSIDFVLCDRRSWKPLLAVIIEGAPGAGAHGSSVPGPLQIAGGKDRIIDEVLGAVGLPLVRGTGRFGDDWAMIRPYVENAILPSATEEQFADEARRARPSGAVSLLRMDDSKGWLLE